MHTAKSLTPNTMAGRLFWHMHAHPGQWLSAWELATKIQTTCLSTYIAEIRHLLKRTCVHTTRDGKSYCVEHDQRGRKHFYRVVEYSTVYCAEIGNNE